MSINKLILSFFLCFSCFCYAEESANPPVTLTLVAEHAAIKPGQEFSVLLEVKLAPDWHLYWKNPGDTGLPPTIEWKLPEGVTVKEIVWPVPERFEAPQAVTFGYSEEAPFYVTFQTEGNLPNEIEIEAEIQWVACSSETCLPGDSLGKTKLKVSKEPVLQADNQLRFNEVRTTYLPQKITPEARTENNRIVFDLPDAEIAMGSNPLFFPEEGTIQKDAVTLTPPAKIAFDETETPLKGILVIGEKAYEIDLTDLKPQAPLAENINWAWALVFALLGGLILNLMPCVLPVVSLKVMSFVQLSGQSRHAQLKHAALFSLGILLSFLALAIVLIVLKTTGQAVGWGFQLQNPFVIACLAMLFAFIGMNLFGVFEMGTSLASLAGDAPMQKQKNAYTASFWNGVFATAVATPCTGPFMGSALGYALVQPAYVSLSVFAALGLGMSLPYLLIGMYPKLIRWMPKPGAWMESFKQFLGFLMFAAVIWLLWVFAGQTDPNALFFLLFALLFAAVGAWILGRWASPIRSKASRRVGYILATLCFVSSLFIAYTASNAGQTHVQNTEIAVTDWEPFSPERLAELKESNTPVLIDFTAKWCLICQTNHWVLTQPEVAKALDNKKVVRMKADWTRHDPAITAELQKHGRSGVPLYVLYSQEHTAKILPQVLTAEAVIQAVNTHVR